MSSLSGSHVFAPSGLINRVNSFKHFGEIPILSYTLDLINGNGFKKKSAGRVFFDTGLGKNGYPHERLLGRLSF